MYIFNYIALFMALGLAGQVCATPPVLHTVLAPKVVRVPAETASAMIKGFVACDTTAALPKATLAQFGVRYRQPKDLVLFSYPNLLTDQTQYPLLGNDVPNLEQVGDGRYITYGAAYTLKPRLSLGHRIQVKAVKTMVNVIPPRAVVSITYVLSMSPTVALQLWEKRLGAAIGPRVDRMPDAQSAPETDVWFTVSEEARSITCWRYPSKSIMKE